MIAAGAIVAAALAGPGEALAQNAGSKGAAIFMQSGCFVCHGQQGFGGIGPRFRDDPFLNFTDYVVGQILLGRGIMPAFAERLDDQQIADVATYIRTSWGNDFGEVKPQEVAQWRSRLSQEQPQTGSSQPQKPPSPANPAQHQP